ncbi:MAG: hypothetical protein KAV87_21850, partial [Desulfobacteraceae bacterium]|nr:hypothetical protein [Desulfobacteraceae bacterium]
VRILPGVLPNQSKTIDDTDSQRTPKSAKNKGVTATRSERSNVSNCPPKVSTDDSTNTANVLSSDKRNNKLSDKLTVDTDLALVVDSWPQLPEAIRSAIVAIVWASNDKNRG